ncbi:hypothetical protein C8R47DRAFT_754685 [Mycena vitilis]|nr:hypothetical protein C8R47DRAFT_754685 [Mycena vitilis]
MVVKRSSARIQRLKAQEQLKRSACAELLAAANSVPVGFPCASNTNGPRDRAPRGTKKPLNSFLLFRRAVLASGRLNGTTNLQNQLSVTISVLWNGMTAAQKRPFQLEARALARPQRVGSNEATGKVDERVLCKAEATTRSDSNLVSGRKVTHVQPTAEVRSTAEHKPVANEPRCHQPGIIFPGASDDATVAVCSGFKDTHCIGVGFSSFDTRELAVDLTLEQLLKFKVDSREKKELDQLMEEYIDCPDDE